MMNASSFKEIGVGDSASFERTISERDVRDFAKLSGDRNPIHLSDSYAKKTKFGGRIVHGMFLGALCSTLIGMYLPGRNSLYIAQMLHFRKPVRVGDTVKISGEVMSVSPATKIVSIAILIKRDDQVVADGLATVQMLV